MSGIPAVGKSSILSKISEIDEKFEIRKEVLSPKQETILEKIYKNEGNVHFNALKFQLSILGTILSKKLEPINKKIIIQERDQYDCNIFIDSMKEHNLLDDDSFDSLKKLISCYDETNHTNHKVIRILLDAPTNVIIQRIKERKQRGEDHFNDDYFKTLQLRHRQEDYHAIIDTQGDINDIARYVIDVINSCINIDYQFSDSEEYLTSDNQTDSDESIVFEESSESTPATVKTSNNSDMTNIS